MNDYLYSIVILVLAGIFYLNLKREKIKEKSRPNYTKGRKTRFYYTYYMPLPTKESAQFI